MVVTGGETDVDPTEGEPAPVEKLVPVQEVALFEDQERVEDCGGVMEGGESESVQVGGGLSTVQLENA